VKPEQVQVELVKSIDGSAASAVYNDTSERRRS